MSDSVPLRPQSTRERRITDRCESCGRFVGRYPVGFCCDSHCWRCVCTRCPGFLNPGSVVPRELPGQSNLNSVGITLCDACLDGEGGECHTPGCALWMNRAPDIPVRDKAFAVTPDPEAGRSGEDRVLDAANRLYAFSANHFMSPSERLASWQDPRLDPIKVVHVVLGDE